MSRNGSGTFSLASGNPVVTGATISSTTHNTTMSDIATALTNSLAKDGQTTPTANLPMGGYKHTGVASATARTDYCTAGQSQDNTFDWLTSVSGADTITASAAIGMSAYAAGQTFRFVSAGANTGAATLNINAIGAKAITKEGTTALAAGDIASGSTIEVTYDGTQFQLIGGRTVQPLDALLTSLAAQTTAANQLQGYSGPDTAALFDIGTASGNVPLVGTKSATTALAGLVEQSTSAENLAGTDDTVFPSVAGVTEMIAMTRTVDVTPIPATGTSLSAAHGLGRVPRFVVCEFVCIDAAGNGGYSQGDVADVTCYWNGTSIYPNSCWKDAVNVGINNFASYEFTFHEKNSGAFFTPSKAKWAYRFLVS